MGDLVAIMKKDQRKKMAEIVNVLKAARAINISQHKLICNTVLARKVYNGEISHEERAVIMHVLKKTLRF